MGYLYTKKLNVNVEKSVKKVSHNDPMIRKWNISEKYRFFFGEYDDYTTRIPIKKPVAVGMSLM